MIVDTPHTNIEREFIGWNGLRIYLKTEGDGDPLLLINGLGGNTAMWRPLVNRIGERRIISFDAPGAGRSEPPLQPLSISALSDLAAYILDYTAVSAADVVGYSYGGAVAQQFAYDHPERVRRLVLAATTCGIGSIPGSFRALRVLATPFRFYSPTYFDRIATVTYGGRTGRNEHVRQRMLTARRKLPPSTYGYAMQLLGGAVWSSIGFLEAIRHETLVISGDDDPLIPVENAEMLVRRMPRSELDIVEEGGHLMLWDDPETLAGRISRFLDRGRRRVRLAAAG
jgi:poly(3-hydroxyalkanoate) depolymerase